MAGPVKGDLQLVAIDMNDIAHAEFLVEHPVARGKASSIALRGEGGLAAGLLPGRHAAPAGAIATALHIAELAATGKLTVVCVSRSDDGEMKACNIPEAIESKIEPAPAELLES